MEGENSVQSAKHTKEIKGPLNSSYELSDSTTTNITNNGHSARKDEITNFCSGPAC